MTDIRHSVANRPEPDDDRLFAPAAARNVDAIIKALSPHLPKAGNALEIASGTGEHITRLAEARPGLVWHPSDIKPERLRSIAAWTAHSRLTNIQPPRSYNAATDAWNGPSLDAIFLSNLLHLVSKEATQAVLSHIASALAPDGKAAIYGPFLRGTHFASEGDEHFDAAIRAENPSSGYKDIGWVESLLESHDLTHQDTITMPANNLLTIWQR